MYERLEFSAKAHFSGPMVWAVVPFNAVHRSCTEDPQLDEAASRCSLTTSQLRDHVFDWRSDPWVDVSHQVNSATFSVPVAHKKGGRPLSHPPSEEMLDAFKAPLPLIHSDGSGAVVWPPEHLLSIKTH